MSLRDNIRTKEEVLKSDYITIAELSLFENIADFHEQQRIYDNRMNENPIENRWEILDL